MMDFFNHMDRVNSIFRGLGSSLLLLLSLVSVELRAEVLFVSSASAEIEELANRVELSLKRAVRVSSEEDLGSLDLTSVDAVVTIGHDALKAWLAVGEHNSIPLVATFMTASDVSNYQDIDSAIYIEPPLNRQIRLAQLIYGKSDLGMLIPSKNYLHSVGVDPRQASKSGVTTYDVSQYPSLAHALADALGESRILIGVYDPVLYGADNLKSILITAYRRSKALIGPSRAYLRAGAMATTYSDLENTEQRLIELLSKGLSQGEWEPPGYNPYFKIGYNDQVARSLNIILPDAREALRQLRGSE